MTRILLPLGEMPGVIHESVRTTLDAGAILLARTKPPGMPVPGILALEGVDLEVELEGLARNASQALVTLAHEIDDERPRPATHADVDREIAVRSFERGFLHGADPNTTPRRVVVEPSTHTHWQCGYEAGRAALRAAVAEYRRIVLR